MAEHLPGHLDTITDVQSKIAVIGYPNLTYFREPRK